MSIYSGLSREELVARLEALEPSSSTTTTSTAAGPSAPTGPPADAPIKKRKGKIVKPLRSFHYHSHPTRHVALLVSYHGWPYSGLALQPPTAESGDVPTVEGELLKAFEKTRLIEAGKGWEGCEFSRCGRTDAGVSGHGQVVDLWVRSARRAGDGGSPLPDGTWRPSREEAAPRLPSVPDANGDESEGQLLDKARALEIPYPKLLNGVLPHSIRILGWSPVPPPKTPDEPFSSRFSCRSRHYKYAFHLVPSPTSPPLSLSHMRDAAASLLGEHDFRNFCKLDGSKQIENHSRRVLQAYFDEEESGSQGMVVFNLIGTAFLWHQVRHIIGVLFLVGAGLERPEVVKALLDTERSPGKPIYKMGSGLPLTLHGCEYDEGALDWRMGGWDGKWTGLGLGQREDVEREDDWSGVGALEARLEEMRQEAEIRSWQIGGALRKLRQIHGERTSTGDGVKGEVEYPTGGGEVIKTRAYQKLMEREKGDTPEVVNQKYRDGKGARKAAARQVTEQ